MKPSVQIILISLLFSFTVAALCLPKTETATFAGGCFWCMTPPFEKLKGVLKVTAGYTDGTGPNPTYEDYAEKGYTEGVQVTYDPSRITYAELVDVFWKQINPIDPNGQFVDRGPQYRAAVFYHNESQRKLAENPGRSWTIRAGSTNPSWFPSRNMFPSSPLRITTRTTTRKTPSITTSTTPTRGGTNIWTGSGERENTDRPLTPFYFYLPSLYHFAGSRLVNSAGRSFMTNIGLLLVQFLHVLFGSILLGGTVLLYFVLWPAILRRPPAEARAFYEGGLKPIRVLMASSGGMTFLLGIVRGTVFGPIHSLESLETPYGLTFLVALVLTLTMLIHGPKIGPLLLRKVWDGDRYSTDAQKIVQRINLIPMVSVVLILACMALMHFGL